MLVAEEILSVCLLSVNISCQSVDVSPESRTVLKQTVEPFQVVAGNTYSPSYIIHGKQRTYSDNVPLLFSEEDVAEDDTEKHK